MKARIAISEKIGRREIDVILMHFLVARRSKISRCEQSVWRVLIRRR